MLINHIIKFFPKHQNSLLRPNQIIYFTLHIIYEIYEKRNDDSFPIKLVLDLILVLLIVLQFIQWKIYHQVHWIIVLLVNGLMFDIILSNRILPIKIFCGICLWLEIFRKQIKFSTGTTQASIQSADHQVQDLQSSRQQKIRSQKYSMIVFFIEVMEYSIFVLIFTSYLLIFSLLVLLKVNYQTAGNPRQKSAVFEILQIQSQKLLQSQKLSRNQNQEIQLTPKLEIITNIVQSEHNREQRQTNRLLSEMFQKMKDPKQFFEQFCQKIKIGLIILDPNEEVVFANKKAYVLINCPSSEDIKKYLQVNHRKNIDINTPISIQSRTPTNIIRIRHDSFLPFASVTKIFQEKQNFTDQYSMKVKTLFSKLSFMNEEEDQQKICSESQVNDQLKFRMRKMIIVGKNHEVFKYKLLMIQNRASKQKSIDATLNHKFKSLLLNSFSHELRTPLNCSQQLLESLEYQIVDEKIKKDYLQPIMSSNYLLLHQINDILDFASFEAENFEYNFQTFSLIDVIENLISVFQPAIKQKGQQIFFKQLTNKPLNNIKNDSRRIQQILVNLMNNSTKFTERKGRIEIIVEDWSSDEYLRITVKDNGVGIDSSKLAILIDLFSNSEQMNFNIQYVGLGLVLANKIAMGLIRDDEFKNYLDITSEGNQGTEISFLIEDMSEKITYNFEESSQDQNLNSIIDLKCFNFEASKGVFDQPCTAQTQILIVDDVPFNILALKALLRSIHKKVDECYNGHEAYSMVENKFKNRDCMHNRCKYYRLILMDIQMPVVDGITALQKINQFFNQVGGLNQTQIVICTAYDDREYFKQSFKLGASGFIVKPVTMEKILPFLNNFLY